MNKSTKRQATVTLLCDKLVEKVMEWRHERNFRGARKGVFATFRDRPNGARFIDVFPQYAGKTISFTYGEDFLVPAAVGEWLFANGYLRPRDVTPLWK